MTHPSLPESLARKAGGTIVLVVLDGLGGLPHPETGRTELETAHTPHLDGLAARGSLGMHDPVGRGITPGSGPAHLALFGYDPVKNLVGRGVLSALGVGFELRPGDVAARLNLATFGSDGRVTDRRAGRPGDSEGRRVVERVRKNLDAPNEIELFLIHEKEHRAVLVLRGEELGAELTDSDPQVTGVVDEPVLARDPGSERTARAVESFLEQSREILRAEPAANGFLARGFAAFEPLPSMYDRFGITAAGVARYPMYRGVARLAGMEIPEVPSGDEETVAVLERSFGSHDFYFVHFKDPDSRGHDGDFDGKVEAIEAVDRYVPRIVGLEPDVLIFTGDHSTPTQLREHSWHAVPTLIASDAARPSSDRFGETECRVGHLGRFAGSELLRIGLAHAGRFDKYGA